MRIALHIPCLVDQWMPEIGVSMLRVLERLGHTITYNPAQTCCGLPALDLGCRAEASDTAKRQLGVYGDAEAIVSPSAACTAMMNREYPELFAGMPEEKDARALAVRTHEFSHFLVGVLGVTDVGAHYEGVVTVQDCCKNRRAGCAPGEVRKLLAKVRGLKIVEQAEEGCCGFGGPFCLAYPALSSAMGEARTDVIFRAGAEAVVTNDPACLIQLRGIMGRRAHPIRGIHIAEVLASV
jgi:L-lactate dehydrogenase complex protein LldE